MKKKSIIFVGIVLLAFCLTIGIKKTVDITNSNMDERIASVQTLSNGKTITTLDTTPIEQEGGMRYTDTIFGKYQFNGTGASNMNDMVYEIDNNANTMSRISNLSNYSWVSAYEENRGADFWINSSAATLKQYKPGDQIYKAYLVLEMSPSNQINSEKSDLGQYPVTLIGPSRNAIKTKPQVITYTGTSPERTAGYIDVTDFVKQEGYGEYVLCNMPWKRIEYGGDRYCSWRLVVIEENENLPIRNLVLEMGFQGSSETGHTLDLTLTNIKTKLSGTVTGQVIYSIAGADRSINDMVNYLKYSPDGNASNLRTITYVNSPRLPNHPFCGLVSRNGIQDTSTVTKFTIPTYSDAHYTDVTTTKPSGGYDYMGDTDFEILDIGESSNHNMVLANNASKISLNISAINCVVHASVIGLAVDIQSPIYNPSLSTIGNTATDGNLTISGSAKNMIPTTDPRNGLINGKATINIDPDITANSVTASFVDANGNKTTIPASQITIDNTNHKVVIVAGSNNNGITENGQAIEFSISAKANNKNKTTYTNNLVVSGDLYYQGVNTGYNVAKVAETNSSINYTRITGTKTWVDDNNAYNTRPDNITLVLKYNNNQIRTTSISKTANEYEFNYVVTKDSTGTYSESNYTISENNISNYTTTQPNGNRNFTNTLDTRKVTSVYDSTQGSVTGLEEGNEETVYYNASNKNNIVVSANYGYKITSIKINDQDVSITNVDQMNIGKLNNITEDKEIVVTFALKDAKVNVKYVDIKTNENIDTETINGKVFDSYTTTQKDFERYLFVRVEGQTTGNMSVEDIDVTYYYIRRSTVTIRYVDEFRGIDLEMPITQEYSQDDTYTSEAMDLDGYELFRNSGNTSGTVVRDDIEVVYYYKAQATLTIRYLDEFSNQKLEDETVVEGLENDSYTTTQKTFTNYVFDQVDGNPSGRLIGGPQTVTYYYIKQSKVTTKYVDYYTQQEISSIEEQIYNQGTDYTTTKKTIDGYQYFSDSQNTSGRMNAQDIEVTYYYKKESSVTAKYIDYYTNDIISAEVVVNGVEGDTYNTEEKEITDYAFVEVEGQKAGQIPAEPIVITYKYKKLSTVTTKFVDSVTGREIADQEINSYPQESNYTTSKKVISGYTYTSNSGNTEGTVERENILVTYYYNVNTSVVARYIDINTGDSISPDVEIRGIEGENYTTTQKDISGYKFVSVDGQTSGNMGPQTTTITYKYEKQSRVYTSYIDEITGNQIISDVSSIYSQGQRYTTIQADINGYTCVGNSNNTEGEMGRQNIYVYYYYRSNSAVNVQYIDYYTNEEVASQERIDGINRQEYTTVQKDVEGYEFADAIGPTSGLMDVDPIDVYYRYKKLSNLIVHHIDANSGEAITEDTVITYRQADNYEANPANLPGYVVVEEPEQKTGKMGRENIEKTYKYKLISGGLVVKYVDIKTNEVLDQKVYDGNEADVIELEYKSIFNYFHITEMDPDFTQITLTGEPQEVTYYYVRRSEVQFRGIDQDTGEILYTETLEPTGVEGDRYQANPRTVEGYTVVKYPENREGIYQRVNPIIIFEYKRNAGLVNVKYVDQAGNIIEQTTLTGDFDTPYRTVQKDIPNYRFVSVDGPITGVYTQEAKEVVYHYERITSKLIVKYIDEEGNELLKTETVGNMGEEYTVTLQDIEGYELDQAPSTLTGTYKETDTTLVVKMKKTETPVVESGTIIVNLIDKDGNVIGERIVNTDEVGKEITITLPDIPGYRLVNGKTITATYINGELVYDAIYEKIPETVYGTIVVKFIDENGEEIRPSQTSRDEQGKSFRFNVPEIEGYTITGQTVLTATYTDGEQILTATYEKNQEPEKEYGTITVKYVDADGNEIKESTTSRGEVGTTFTATAPEIEGYELVGNKNINDTYQTGDKVITVTYKAVEIPIEPDPKDDPAPTPTPTPEPQPQPKQEEKTVDTSDLNVALMLVVALTSVIGIKIAKKELEK